jgi:hypothetical protein
MGLVIMLCIMHVRLPNGKGALVLRAKSNAYRDLEPLVEEPLRAIGSIGPGTVVRVPPEG